MPRGRGEPPLTNSGTGWVHELEAFLCPRDKRGGTDSDTVVDLWSWAGVGKSLQPPPPRLTLDLLWPREKVRAPSITPPTGKLHSGRRTPISWEMAPRERTLGLVWERIQGRLTASAGRKHKQPSKELKSSLPYRWGQ